MYTIDTIFMNYLKIIVHNLNMRVKSNGVKIKDEKVQKCIMNYAY